MAKSQQQQSPPSDIERIRARKDKVTNTIINKFGQPVWRDRLLKICGGDESKIMKSINSFVAYILSDDGGKEGNKKYIADCTLASISMSFLEAFQMGIEIGGGRDHAYLVNYSNNCELEISYKGFVYALNKHFDNVFVEARCVFEGDKFIPKITDQEATYEFIPDINNIDNETWERLKLCFCYFSYTERGTGRKVSRLGWIPKGKNSNTPDSLEMIRSKARGSRAWVDFPFQQCCKSTLRRNIKIPFASIDFGDDDVDPETVDNRHYQLENGDSSNKLKLLLEKHQEMIDDEKPDEPTKNGEAPQVPASSHNNSQPTTVSDGPQGNNDSMPSAVVSPAPGSEDTGNNATGYSDISEADFGDPADGQIIDHAPMPTTPPIDNEPAAPSPALESAWDGKTLFIGGKSQQNDFPNAGAAAIYLKKVIANRKHKQSRLDIIKDNSLLIATLIREGNKTIIDDLHKLASQGE